MTESPQQSATSPKPRLDLSGAVWRRSSFSTVDGPHIEIAFIDDHVAMRDGSKPDGAVLVFTPGEWDAFVGGAKDGEFDFA